MRVFLRRMRTGVFGQGKENTRLFRVSECPVRRRVIDAIATDILIVQVGIDEGSFSIQEFCVGV